MKIEVIGRDPVLTYQIIQLIIKRAERKRIWRSRIDAVKHPIKTIKKILNR